jgi:RNA polymerase sigma-70 factor, ECF subfamily
MEPKEIPTTESLFRDFYVRARRYAGKLFSSSDDAVDATYEALIHAQEQYKTSEKADNPQAWITTIIKRKLIDIRRRRARISKMEHSYDDPNSPPVDSFPDEDSNPLASLELLHKKLLLEAALARLPEHYRLALLLKYFSDVSQAQAAKQMGMSVEAFNSLLQRARASLRDKIIEIMNNEESALGET